VRPEDREAVRAFLAGLSLDSAYRRFFTGIGSPSSTLVRRLVEVDHDRRSALLAVAGGERAGREISGGEVVGLADTAVLADGVTVELGVVIADAWQRRGLGPRLVAAALAPAVARGCTTLRAHTLPDNARVARLLHRRWPGADPAWDGDCLVWTLPLRR
jgi:acetyltransferase